MVRGHDKLDVLTRILEAEDELDAAIILCAPRSPPMSWPTSRKRRGHAAAALNGDMTQGLRERADQPAQIDRSTSSSPPTSPPAASGRCASPHVINYDVPLRHRSP